MGEALRKIERKNISGFMSEMLVYSATELEQVMTNPSESAARRIAATQLLYALNGVGDSVDRVMDRTEGKSKQVILNFNQESTAMEIGDLEKTQEQLNAERYKMILEGVIDQ